MKQYIDKSAVIAEIEKLQDSTMDEDGNFYSPKEQAEYNVLCVLEEYLDTLEVKEISVDLVDPKEEPASEGLEEAATKYAQDKYLPVQTAQSFKAGANWQEEQTINKACEFIETYPHLFMGVLRSEVIEDFKNSMKGG